MSTSGPSEYLGAVVLLSSCPGLVIPEPTATGYSRGRLPEPTCGKRAAVVTLSGAPVKTKHTASFLGAKLQQTWQSCSLGTKEVEIN